MIKTKKDYLDYLQADKVSLGRKWSIKSYLFDDIWRFQRLLRRLEYLTNCKKSRLRRAVVAFAYHRAEVKLGFTIPINVFGPGLAIAHRGTIVVNRAARIGANCRIHVCVNVGTEAGKGADAPTIGENCYIGPGAKIFGKIRIGDNTAIGANSVVNADFLAGNATLGGVPAKVISHRSSEGLLVRGYVHRSLEADPACD